MRIAPHTPMEEIPLGVEIENLNEVMEYHFEAAKKKIPCPECAKKDEEIARWQARCHENDCKADSYDHIEAECAKLRAQLAALVRVMEWKEGK